MREDDWTGSLIDDEDEALLAADVDLYEFDADDEALADEYALLGEHEQVINFAEAANGAKSLREAAEKLYDLADEMIALAEDGWDIVDDIAHGQGTAVQFDTGDDVQP
jgi:hypothetical protein